MEALGECPKQVQTCVNIKAENIGDIAAECSQPFRVLNADRYNPLHIIISPK